MAAESRNPRVLMIAYHFPPFAGSSGVQRTLKYSRYLPESRWEPVVLTANPRAYVQTRQDLLASVPADLTVVRSAAFDTARHMAIGGRYPGFLALPDRWASWALSAIPTALRLVRKHRVSAIWSTYPIATAHFIAGVVARATGLPWIADFRDPMTEGDYPSDPRQRKVFQSIERKTVTRATRVVMTTPGAIRMYRERYPELPESRWVLIPNGYDEEDFAPPVGDTGPAAEGPLMLLHSGSLYPSERDPTAFLAALAELRDAGAFGARGLRVLLRATGHDAEIGALVRRFRLHDIVEFAPPLAHRASLAEMLQAHGLLLLQAANCNHQIPAKLYEYLRSGRPVLGLTDPLGDTGRALIDAGFTDVVSLDDQAAIRKTLIQFLDRIARGVAKGAASETAAAFSRRSQSADLARLLFAVSREE